MEEGGGPAIYAFVHNNPVSGIDPDGNDYLLVYLEKGACGVSHYMLFGDDGVAGYYSIDFYPDVTKPDSWQELYRICGPGRYDLRTGKNSAAKAVMDFAGVQGLARHVVTSPTQDKYLAEAARQLGNTRGIYCVNSKDCRSVEWCLLARAIKNAAFDKLKAWFPEGAPK